MNSHSFRIQPRFIWRIYTFSFFFHENWVTGGICIRDRPLELLVLLSSLVISGQDSFLGIRLFEAHTDDKCLHLFPDESRPQHN